MSATRDKTQKIAFVYSNLYQIYKKGTEAASAAVISPSSPASPVESKIPSFEHRSTSTQHVLKTADLNGEGPLAKIRISEYQPAELIGKRLPKPEALQNSQPLETQPQQASAIQSLKENLKNLNDLHSRLRFMLEELETLVKS